MRFHYPFPLTTWLAAIAMAGVALLTPPCVAPLRAQAAQQATLSDKAKTDTAKPDTPDRPAVVERDVEQRKLEMARLAQEIQRESEQYAKRPKRKYISANTKEYEFAAYMRAWVARIERIGNLNYPDDARRQQLHGQLVLTVGLTRDGHVKSMDVIQSSGHKALDDAAIRIVHLAEPFPALPEDKEKVDELYITRTWQFLPGDILRNR